MEQAKKKWKQMFKFNSSIALPHVAKKKKCASEQMPDGLEMNTMIFGISLL